QLQGSTVGFECGVHGSLTLFSSTRDKGETAGIFAVVQVIKQTRVVGGLGRRFKRSGAEKVEAPANGGGVQAAKTRSLPA
ncbi:hypothetical protein, partial [Pseudomonas sp.]|uniref:hypothetical protein n=1 Tax=Pseudomonas sp. TaxID=306 RepID=UPI0028A5E747